MKLAQNQDEGRSSSTPPSSSGSGDSNGNDQRRDDDGGTGEWGEMPPVMVAAEGRAVDRVDDKKKSVNSA